MKLTGERVILEKSENILRRRHLARYKFAEGYIKGKKVLDVGCGTGYGTSLLAQTAEQVVGIDISKKAIDYAKENYSGKNIRFFIGNAVNLNFLKKNSFDIIVSFEVIEHIAEYRRYLEEMSCLLKPEGILIISTPNKRYSSPNSEKPENPFHVIEFRLSEFRKLMEEYFSEVKIYGQNPQMRIKQFVKRLLPRRVLKMIFLQKMGDAADMKRALKFTEKNIEACRYFIAVCRGKDQSKAL